MKTVVRTALLSSVFGLVTACAPAPRPVDGSNSPVEFISATDSPLTVTADCRLFADVFVGDRDVQDAIRAQWRANGQFLQTTVAVADGTYVRRLHLDIAVKDVEQVADAGLPFSLDVAISDGDLADDGTLLPRRQLSDGGVEFPSRVDRSWDVSGSDVGCR
ncbi:MAG: hypothetical protein U0228_24380 [Myxococcaceae bacterium]